MPNARYEHVLGAKKHANFIVFALNHGATNLGAKIQRKVFMLSVQLIM